MSKISNTTLLRRDLMIRLTKAIWQDQPLENINAIPVQMTPKKSESSIRCCIYRERAVTRSGMIALMGFDNTKDDEIRPLSDYARQALNEEILSPDILTVLQEGCSSCIRNNYIVTDACRGCVARPCQMNCPKDAITFVKGKATIDPGKCINCGICQKKCPFHAITYVPVPCEDACPVDAIGKDENGKVSIDKEKCILCGKCKTSCPFGAIFEKSHLINVIKALKSERKVVAMFAPALGGQFPDDYGKLLTSLRKVGFDHLAEVAWGADLTAAHEAAEWKEKMEESKPFLTTSCCPSYVLLAKNRVKDINKFVSSTPSPMVYTAQECKRLWPEARTVFIGPCLAKKQEAFNDINTDYVISFEELGTILAALNIQLADQEPGIADLVGSRLGKGFAASGGVAAALSATDQNSLKIHKIDGITSQSVKVLNAFSKGKCPGNFLEVMACEGGCIAGPNSLNTTDLAKRLLTKHLKES